jgi:integrase
LFSAWLEQHAKRKLDTWKDEKRRYEMYFSGSSTDSTLPDDAVPYRIKKELALGPRIFAEIERRDVVPSVMKCWTKLAIQSNRVVALFNRVANWSVEEGHVKFILPLGSARFGEERRRERLLSPDELVRLWDELNREIVIDRLAGGQTTFDLPQLSPSDEH